MAFMRNILRRQVNTHWPYGCSCFTKICMKFACFSWTSHQYFVFQNTSIIKTESWSLVLVYFDHSFPLWSIIWLWRFLECSVLPDVLAPEGSMEAPHSNVCLANVVTHTCMSISEISFSYTFLQYLNRRHVRIFNLTYFQSHTHLQKPLNIKAIEAQTFCDFTAAKGRLLGFTWLIAF